MVAVEEWTGNLFLFSSFRSSMIGIASLSAKDIPVYSDSVLDNAISVWSWDFHRMGHPAYHAAI
jgi:hypothetical protein